MKTVIEDIRFIWKYISHPWRTCAMLLFLGLAFAIIDMAEPVVAGNIMDTVFSLGDRNTILQWGMLWCVLFVVKYAVRYGKMKLGLSAMLRTLQQVQMDFYHRLLRAPLPFFEKHSTGYLMARQNDDVFNLEGMMPHHLMDGLLGLLEVLVILGFMFHTSFWLGLAAILLKGVDAFSNFYFPLKKLYKDHNEARARTGSELQDVLRNILLVKSACQERKEETRFRRFLDRYYNTWNKRDTTNTVRMLLTAGAEDGSYMVMIILGGVLLYQGQLTIGELTAFLLFYRKLSSAFVAAVPLIPLFKIAQGAKERIEELWQDMPLPLAEGCEEIFSLKKGITFSHVQFSYGNRLVLKDVSMIFLPGQVTAVVGKSGAGKSTILNLLMRFRDRTGGTITWDGNDMQAYKPESVRRHISYLSQDALLFHRSLRENILYETEKKISATHWRNVLQKSNAEDILQRWDQMAVADSGKNMSGGERQRICLARELLKDGDVFIFDEATSALDAETEKVIQQTIQELAKTKIVILIAHRLSTVRQADRIYVLDDGRVVESGTHEQLMQTKGSYYQLFKEQELSENERKGKK